jgi:hypothetical protein
VIDLSRLNKSIPADTFRISNPQRIRAVLKAPLWFSSIDIRDAFPHFPIHPRLQKYLAFKLKDQLYFFTALPFGLNIGPKIFTKVAKLPLRRLHQLGIAAAFYIDDWLFWAPTAQQCHENTRIAIDLLLRLGFNLHFGKSILQPQQSIEFLGVILDGNLGTISPAPRHLARCRIMTSELLDSGTISRLQHQAFLGLLNFMVPYLQYARHFFFSTM